MCVICGCGRGGEHAQAPAVAELHYGHGPAGASLPGQPALRLVQIEADVLGANQRLADRNRAHFAAHGVTAYNLLSSPGSGKTTLLCATIAALRQRSPQLPLAVIEGDQQTRLDAERIRAAGAPAIQVNTGRGCHLDAQMVGEAFERIDLHGHAHAQGHAHPHPHDPASSMLFIENVGNLVCPALWDLGEAAKVVILSVTEGEDKPLKYPDMFAAATLLLINKTDLLPYVQFDVARCIALARQVNPGLQVLQLSATRGDGLEAWVDWLLRMPAEVHTS
jgi:hydrogenase nickel incorporation protein HypB